MQRKSVSGPQKQETDTQGDDNFNTKPGTESNEYLKTNETCFSQAVSAIEYLYNSSLIG